ncbi:MAG: hypothetical protein KGP35_06795 [Bacteroidetes bacterium]|nr:hypothetical protein [Bacteroidota bacterium]
MRNIRYCIIRLEVTHPGQVVEISQRLPMHVNRCTGYLSRHTQGIISGSDLPEIGLLALEFNSRKQLYINDVIGFQKDIGDIPEYLDVDIPLMNGQLVTGYYLDTRKIEPKECSHKVFAPYKVSIYLRCDYVKPDKDVRSSAIHTTAAGAAKY